jgi:hypothetical protein
MPRDGVPGARRVANAGVRGRTVVTPPGDGLGRRTGRTKMADGTAGRGVAGISLGGILVIVGIVVAIVWSVWVGIIVALIGLLAFGGFVRGRWY